MVDGCKKKGALSNGRSPFRGECDRTVLDPEIGVSFSCHTQLFVGRDDVDGNRGIVAGNHRVRSGTVLIFFII